MTPPQLIQLLGSEEVDRLVDSLASNIIRDHDTPLEIALIGIRTRGVPLAHRLAHRIAQKLGSDIGPDVGALDITFFRDDLQQAGLRTPDPTDMPRDLTNRYVVLVDDVIFRGRTIRAALEALHQFGRPQRVRLGVMIDRGHREFPIQPDYVGQQVESQLADVVKVHLVEQDGENCVLLQAC